MHQQNLIAEQIVDDIEVQPCARSRIVGHSEGMEDGSSVKMIEIHFSKSLEVVSIEVLKGRYGSIFSPWKTNKSYIKFIHQGWDDDW